MADQAAVKTPIEPGIVARVAAGVRYALTGKAPDWFGPGQPMQPMAQEEAQGRAFDFPYSYNTRYRPRDGEPVTFEQLRGLADNCDVLRLVIETRKDQIEKMPWRIKTRVEDDAENDPRCDAIMDFLRFPDREHTWTQWLRMVLEDMFVIDAPAIYVRPTKGGQLYALEQIDGATIKRVLSADGRTPIAPDPAYQQIIKGVPAVDYSAEELLYLPRNPRIHKIYGFSPVEQVIMTVNMALRRQVHQLQYYTEGNIPEALATVPATWNPDQIRQYQMWWDELVEGDTASRRHLKFIPDGTKYIPTKESVLKDEFDEWLARVVCFAFSIAPTPFVKQMNRATAETAQEAALQEGLAPIQKWIKGLMDIIIARCFQAPDLEFSWEEEESISPDIQATINDRKVRNGTLTINEARAKDGMDPIEGGDEPLIYTAAGAVLLKDIINPPEPPPVLAVPVPPGPGQHLPPAGGGSPPPPDKGKGNDDPLPKPGGDGKAKEALGKAKKSTPHIDRERRSIVRQRNKLKKVVGAFLAKQGKAIAAQLIEELGKDAITDTERVERVLRALNLEGWADLVGDVGPIIEAITKDGAAQALAQIGLKDSTDEMLSLVNEQAVAYSQDRAAELVGMKWVDGELVENPNPEWAITDSTREMLRGDVAQAMESGMSNDDLAALLQDNYAFSDERAEVIARTETAFADVAGNMTAYRESGLVEQKKWITAAGCCDLCQELDGIVVDLDEDFPNEGGDGPPLHPQCFLPGTKVSAVDVSAHYSRRFCGEIVIIGAPGMDDLSVTPNHPILTDRGWIVANDLEVHDKLVQCVDPAALALLIEPQHNYIESLIEDVPGSLLVSGGMAPRRVPTAAEHFHGDGIPNGEVSIVRTDGPLPCVNEILGDLQPNFELGEWRPFCAGELLYANCPFAFSIERHGCSPDGIMCSRSECRPLLGGSVGHSEEHRLAGVPNLKAHALPPDPERGAVATDAPGYINAALAGHVSLVEINHIGFAEYDGHVYNLETGVNWYLANGIVVHNCRCDVIPIVKDQSSQQTEEE